MSLILDALRKSEAERQAASLPGLISPPHSAIRRRRQRPMWLWLLPVVLGAGLAVGWWVPRWLAGSPGSSPPLPDRAVMPAKTATDAAPEPVGPAPEGGPAQTRDPSPAPPPLAATRPAAPAIERPPVAAEPEAPPPGPLVAEPIAATPGSTAATTATSTSSIPEAARLALMPSAMRQQLPELKLSVHVFNDDPANRFAIVDGRRVIEGDALGGNVVLRAIRREGLLLDIDGAPWLLERPR